MKVHTTVFAVALLACGLGAAPAQAQSQGILTCQISLSQFAEDVYASKARLTPAQLEEARKVVDVGRSQCRSGPDLVLTDIQTSRAQLDLAMGRRMGSRFSDFWPASPDELAQLEE